MASYSFDVVSDFDRQELVNTLDQVRRDVGNRYDLKDSGTEIDLAETEVVITTASDMTLQAVEDILRTKATKRDLSLKIFDFQTPEAVGGNRVKQVIQLRKGLSQELAKKLSKMVRDELKKVTVAIQGESLRITGNQKDHNHAIPNVVGFASDSNAPLHRCAFRSPAPQFVYRNRRSHDGRYSTSADQRSSLTTWPLLQQFFHPTASSVLR